MEDSTSLLTGDLLVTVVVDVPTELTIFGARSSVDNVQG